MSISRLPRNFIKNSRGLTGALNGVGATGSYLGGFYGPNAAEAGYVFNAWTGTPGNPGFGAVGAFDGKQ